MNRIAVPLLILSLVTLACGQYVGTPTPTASPSPAITPSSSSVPTGTPKATPTPAGTLTATIQATVYVRQFADASSDEIGSLTTGATVEIVECSGTWCQIKKPYSGYVWRGCTSNNPDKLLCQAKP